LVIGFIWYMDAEGYSGGRNAIQTVWLSWTAFALTLYAGLTMVTNVPFYSFKDISFKRSVPFIVIVAIALGIALISYDTPRVLFIVFCIYGVSGYGVYSWKRFKGWPVSMIATSIDEPDEKGLHD
jgi:CDP-diacylglycerol---serine O-phosphatidyltransferase